MLRLMKVDSIRCLGVLSLVSGLLASCASDHSGASAGDPAPQKKGHWVTIPAQTGSFISRQVWVDDNGQTDGSPSVNNVQNGSAADVQRMQNNSSGLRPPGN